MNLCIDIGNTRTKLGLFDPAPGRGMWVSMFDYGELPAGELVELLDTFAVKAAILANTREFDPQVRTVLERVDRVIYFDHRTPVPVANLYATPETLGRDRLAAVCGAHDLYPGANVLVVDAGTCITLDFLSADGAYYGGSIHPGIDMRLRALNNYTGNLPLVQKRSGAELIGDSTESSILAGVAYAVIREMDGMIDDYTGKFGELKVIITGGDSPFFVSQSKKEIFAHSNLVLTGLNKILEYNVARL